MKEIKSLKFNIYEYLMYCDKVRCIRGVGIITDKQFIFYSQLLQKDYATHDDILIKIEKHIHPLSLRSGWDATRENNAYLFAVGSCNFIIQLPDNNQFSKSQLSFLTKVLDMMENYNNQQEREDAKVQLIIFTSNKDHFQEQCYTDIKQVKIELNEMITKKIKIEEEKIIGQTLTKEEIKTNLEFHIGLSECTNIQELYSVINRCLMYYNDSYYKDVFLELFPDYLEIVDLCKILNKFNVNNKIVQNISFENIKSILQNMIKNIFKNNVSYKKIREFVYKLYFMEIDNTIESIFPKFKLFSRLIDNIKIFNKEEELYINNLLKNVSTYEEIFKVIFKIACDKKIKKINTNEQFLSETIVLLEKNEIKKNIIANKVELNEMIRKGNELNESLIVSEIELKKIKILIEQKLANIDNNNQIIEQSSNNLLKKIFYRKEINEREKKSDIFKLEIENLEAKKEIFIKKINEIKESIKMLEEKFKSITHLEFLPSNEEFMEFYYDEKELLNEEDIKKWMSNLKKEIIEIKKELNEFVNLGLLNLDEEISIDENIVNEVMFEKNKK